MRDFFRAAGKEGDAPGDDDKRGFATFAKVHHGLRSDGRSSWSISKTLFAEWSASVLGHETGARRGSRIHVRLVEPASVWQDAFLHKAREWAAAGESRYELALRDFDAYLEKVERRRRGDDMDPGKVPRLEFWLESEGQILAGVRVRLQLTEALMARGGHIGYDVRPSMRRRGIGTELLRLALLEARARGIARVLITCDEDNLGSRKVIEHNGGVLAELVLSNESGECVCRYWIEPCA